MGRMPTVIQIIFTQRNISSIRYALLLLTILIFRVSFAQVIISNNAQQKYRAVKWGLNEGLSHGSVFHMIKDVNGFLWIGTQNELSRFDGSVFKNYYHDPNKPGTINAGNTGGGMVEDSLHNIWIGTDKGVCRYDIQADTFTSFLPATPYTVVFGASRDEVFCLEFDSIITTYNIHSFTKKTLATLTSADSPGFGISSSFFDISSNSIWLLRGYSGSFGGPPGGGLLQISLPAGKKKYFDWQCYKNIAGHHHGAEGMRYDKKRNCLWINSWEGLMQFTLEDKQFHYIGALNSFFNAKDYGHWVGICLDMQNRVWLATKPKGIVIYDPSDHSVTFPFAEDTILQKEISDYNAALYGDRDGIVWSGFWKQKGIYQLLPFSQVAKHYSANPNQAHSLSSNNVNAVISAGHGKIWMGTEGGGLNIFDAQTGLFQVLHEKDLPGIKMKNLIVPIMIDSITQKAWLGTDEGFFATDMVTKQTYPVIYRNQDNQLIPALNETIAQSYKKEVVITGSYGNQQGIFILNTDSNIAHQVLSFPENTFNPFFTIVAGNHLIFLKGQIDPLGNQTYTKRNGKWIHTLTPIDSIEWSAITYDEKDSTYWVAGERQLFHFDKNFRVILEYSHENGFPEFRIGSMVPDNKENIWFNTDRSIHQLNIKTGVITRLSEKDGFENLDFSTGTHAGKDESGNIYFPGGMHGVGFIQINPDKFISPSSSMYLQSLEINQRSFPLSTGVNNLQELSLKYFQNKITIETGVIDYYSKGSSHIRYKLEGLNDNWQYGPANYTIRYDGLPPGKYKLVMQASNAANEFNGPLKSLLIQISPPFWKTWWFYLLVAISLATGVYLLFRYRLRQKINLFEMRNRISQDLHDEIGASMSGINLLGQMAAEKLEQNKPEEASVYLVKVKNYTQDVIEKLSDMVWVFNPQNDSIEKLLERLKYFTISVALSKNIKVHFVTDKTSETINLTIRQRKAMYLISKEAINNAFKSSGCSNIYYHLMTNGSKWRLRIQDDGKGFVPAENLDGNGLRNMKARADEIGAKFSIQSQQGAGTTILLEL